MEFTFWVNVLSPHLVELLRGLSESCRVAVVTTMKMPDDRLRLGWSEEPIDRVSWMKVADEADIDRICAGQSASEVNILGGFRGLPLASVILRTLSEQRARIGVALERPDTRGLIGYGRHILYSYYRARFHRSIDFILAHGKLGEEWFVEVGWPAERVFPFAYVVDCPKISRRPPGGRNRPFRIIFVGQFIRRKGVDILLHALKLLRDMTWTCLLVGAGDQQKSWEALASRLGISRRVSFHAPVKMNQAWQLIAESDLLVLPSRFDGWGAVVNEALMCGVPVVCSDNCGAADLLHDPWRGGTFKTGSVESLRNVLSSWIERGSLGAESSARILEWSSAIHGQRAAQYVLDIVGYLQRGGRRPSPPWY